MDNFAKTVDNFAKTVDNLPKIVDNFYVKLWITFVDNL